MNKILKSGFSFLVRDGSDVYALSEVIDNDTYGFGCFPIPVPGILIDIGAHIGGFSITHSSKFKQIFSIEPDDSSRFCLAQNIADNNIKNILISDCLISNKTGEQQFFIGATSVRNSVVDTPLCKKTNTITKYSMTLPDFFTKYNINREVMLKIDIEGGEWQLLFSLPSNFWEKIKGIVMETHESLNSFGNTTRLVELVRNMGFLTRWKKQWFIDNTLAGILQIWKP